MRKCSFLFIVISLIVLTPSNAWSLSGHYGYINKSGTVVVEPKFEMAEPFAQGLAAVKINKKWGYIDHSGKVIIEPQFDVAHQFSPERLAVVRTGNGTVKKCGIITQSGSFLLSLQSEMSLDTNYSDGMLMFGKMISIKPGVKGFENIKDWKFGYLDVSGHIAIQPKFSQVWGFSEGLAVVANSSRLPLQPTPPKCGVIDKKGNVVVPIKFARVLEADISNNSWLFREGLCRMADPKTLELDL